MLANAEGCLQYLFENNVKLIPNWVEAMVKAKAIVTAEGSFLCHTAIIARELGIPCITGIGNKNLRKLTRLKNIVVNGDTGGIKEYCQSKKKK